MWVTLNIVTFLSLLAALGYVAFAARRLDTSLGAMLEDQAERRRDIERNLERTRQSLESSFPRKRESSF
jgi:hypothetical protein